ncbi:MAG: hypothetical protein V5A44_03470 [Haloarculaceae archaeon]
MPLGNADLRSDRTRSPAAFLLDEPEASHAYAWLFRHGPTAVEAYVGTADVNDRQARLAVNRLYAHGLLTETTEGYAADPVRGVVEEVHVTPGVAAVVAKQLENYAVRKLVRRHGVLPLAKTVECWPRIREETLASREVGEYVGIGRHDGVTATNALRSVEDYLELDPYLRGPPASPDGDRD